MSGFIEVTCTRKNGSAYKRLIAVEEIVSVIEENNYAFIEFVKTKNRHALFGTEVTETYAEVCNKIVNTKGASA